MIFATTDGLSLEDEFARDVRAGLASAPKRLPSRWFYDEVGSALFEVITLLPEYYLTRAEQEIFDAHAERIVEALPGDVEVVELGSGSASKTRTLLRALARRQPSLVYRPIDISESALATARSLLAADFPHLSYEPVVGRYRAGLETLRADPRRKLILFIGSSIGNFTMEEAGAFLASIRATMGPEDRLLLGTDLEKDAGILEPAYDDGIGVTAAFNLNLLARINRELGGDFDLDRFRHVTFYNQVEHRIESYLESVAAQKVRIRGLNLTVDLAKGERIHTEFSHKFTPAMVDELAAKGDLVLEQSWTDARGWFALHLLKPAAR